MRFLLLLPLLLIGNVSALSCAIINGKPVCPTEEETQEWVDMQEKPIACTMDVRLCPDGVTYVGREGPNCEFAACPSAVPPATDCNPYVCSDGTRIDRCAPDGTVINYFAEPCLTHGGEEGALFEDVTSDHANADAIFYVKQQGIVKGYDDGTYGPERTINRAEFAKIIGNASLGDRQYAQEFWMCSEGEAGPGAMAELQSRNPFKDIDVRAWYAFPVCIALKANYIQGYPDGTFRPSNSINFVEAAKILVKAFGLEATTTIPACEGACPWYEGYVRMLEAHAAIPLSITSFDQQITRGDMAEMIYRLKAGNNDKPTQTYDALAGIDTSLKVWSNQDCAAAFEETRTCPDDHCTMDCAQRDYPNGGLGCPPGCFAKP